MYVLIPDITCLPHAVGVPTFTLPFLQDAKKDEACRKAYKYLASLHEVWSQALVKSHDMNPSLSGLSDGLSCLDLSFLVAELQGVDSVCRGDWRGHERDPRPRGAGDSLNRCPRYFLGRMLLCSLSSAFEFVARVTTGCKCGFGVRNMLSEFENPRATALEFVKPCNFEAASERTPGENVFLVVRPCSSSWAVRNWGAASWKQIFWRRDKSYGLVLPRINSWKGIQNWNDVLWWVRFDSLAQCQEVTFCFSLLFGRRDARSWFRGAKTLLPRKLYVYRLFTWGQ